MGMLRPDFTTQRQFHKSQSRGFSIINEEGSEKAEEGRNKEKCRGEAFPYKSLNLQNRSQWECFAQISQRSDNFTNPNQEGLAFADRDFSDEFKDGGANAKPLQVNVLG